MSRRTICELPVAAELLPDEEYVLPIFSEAGVTKKISLGMLIEFFKKHGGTVVINKDNFEIRFKKEEV